MYTGMMQVCYTIVLQERNMEFLTQSGVWWVYLCIFLGKIIEVSVSTVRVVLINRGERLFGAIIAFFEVSIWLVVTGTVLVGFQNDIWRCFVFALAFACGNYFGSWMEDKLAFGLSSVQIIVSDKDEAEDLIENLRKNDFAVTVFKGEGKDGDRHVLTLHLKRKRIPAALSIIKERMCGAVVTVNDVRVVKGGYIKK